MPVEIQSVMYFTATEVAKEVGVTRQTLWRWGQAGSIPEGRRDRRRRHLFTASEVKLIKDYATQLLPANATSKQLRLFKNNGPKKRGGG